MSSSSISLPERGAPRPGRSVLDPSPVIWESTGNQAGPSTLRTISTKTTKTTNSNPINRSDLPFTPPTISQPYAATSRLRPLSMSMSHHPNLPAIEDRGEPQGGSRMGSGKGSTTRLKRLSLLSKSLVIPLPSAHTAQDGDGDRRIPATASVPIQRIPSSTGEETRAGEAGPSTPMTSTRKARDRQIGGVRSSISYAYSPRTLSRVQGGDKRNGQVGSEGRGEAVGTGSSFNDRGSMAPPSLSRLAGSIAAEDPIRSDGGLSKVEKQETKGVTLTEKHADLLTLIAHKERKVNELKLELAQQEQSLNQLKERWTTIVSRSTRPFTTRSSSSVSSSASSSSALPLTTAPRRSDKPTPRPLTSSPTNVITDPAITSLLDNASSADDITLASAQNVLNNLIATAYGPEGVVTPSAVEGGKRFWGQLVKTVSAAAGGNVPDLQEGSGREVVGNRDGQGEEGMQPIRSTLDISSLKDIVSLTSWSALTSPPLPSSTSASSSISATSSSNTRSIPQPANISRLPQRSQGRPRETSAASVSSTSASETSASDLLKTPLSKRDRAGARPSANGDAISVSTSEYSKEHIKPGANFQDLMDMEESFESDTASDKTLQRPIPIASARDLLIEQDDGVVDEDEWGL